jgi:hypothetical protein
MAYTGRANAEAIPYYTAMLQDGAYEGDFDLAQSECPVEYRLQPQQRQMFFR